MPGCGIWQGLRLEAVASARIDNMHIRTIQCHSDVADIRLGVRLDKVKSQNYRCELNVTDGYGVSVCELEFDPHGTQNSVVFHIYNPKLWMPNGYGKAHLYNAKLKLFAGDDIVDSRNCKFGIRTVKLDRSADKAGDKFRFEINGVPIWARGADWIPASVFAGSVSDEDYRHLITAAAQANMNMLRVMGRRLL